METYSTTTTGRPNASTWVYCAPPHSAFLSISNRGFCASASSPPHSASLLSRIFMFNHSATSPRVFLSWRGRFPFDDFFVSARPPPHPVFFCPGVVDFPSKIFRFCESATSPRFLVSACLWLPLRFFALVRRDFGSRRIAGLALARRDRASSRSSRSLCDCATPPPPPCADLCTMAAQLDQIAA